MPQITVKLTRAPSVYMHTFTLQSLLSTQFKIIWMPGWSLWSVSSHTLCGVSWQVSGKVQRIICRGHKTLTEVAALSARWESIFLFSSHLSAATAPGSGRISRAVSRRRTNRAHHPQSAQTGSYAQTLTHQSTSLI